MSTDLLARPANINPYASPLEQADGKDASDRSQSLSLGKLDYINTLFGYSQLAVVIFIVLFFSAFTSFVPSEIGWLVGAMWFVNWGLQVTLAWNVYHIFGAIMTAFFLWIPLVNIFTVLAVHDRTKKVLGDHGFTKGTFAMNVSEATRQQLALGTYVAPERPTTNNSITFALLGALICAILGLGVILTG